MELRICFVNPKNEDSYLRTHRHENLKSYNHKNFLHWPKKLLTVPIICTHQNFIVAML
jgi:hypothetical protein